MGVNTLPKTVTRQRRGCDLNPGHSAPEYSTLTTRLPSYPIVAHSGTLINAGIRPFVHPSALCPSFKTVHLVTTISLFSNTSKISRPETETLAES